ncbi:MAG TPA: hypothetical protein VGS97_09685 [Actinocrinis sp.]|uniref:hypothetical protein n=1 Tax=Actinocrinis sp. TaxID=1920516 RepID=UPI002DDCA46A|nr:hypothetical protein [Actinocrinis sp.]HEV2344351.1 hypothetical protein [Actinocrinis sp.]
MTSKTKVPVDVESALAEMAAAVVRQDAEASRVKANADAVVPARREAVVEFMQHGAGRPWWLRLQADVDVRAAAQKLDEADRLEYVAQLRAVLDRVNAEAEQAWSDEDRLAAALTAAAEAEKAATDRVRDAEQNRDQAVERERWSKDYGATAAVQTEALARARAAADVYARERAACEGAQAVRAHAEKALAEARARTAAVEKAQDAASAAVRDPGRIPRSPWTMTYDGIRRLIAGERLTEDETAIAGLLVDTLARRLGLDVVYRNEARSQMEREKELRQAAQILPARGSKAPVGQIVSPPGSPAVASRLVPNR